MSSSVLIKDNNSSFIRESSVIDKHCIYVEISFNMINKFNRSLNDWQGNESYRRFLVADVFSGECLPRIETQNLLRTKTSMHQKSVFETDYRFNKPTTKNSYKCKCKLPIYSYPVHYKFSPALTMRILKGSIWVFSRVQIGISSAVKTVSFVSSSLEARPRSDSLQSLLNKQSWPDTLWLSPLSNMATWSARVKK